MTKTLGGAESLHGMAHMATTRTAACNKHVCAIKTKEEADKAAWKEQWSMEGTMEAEAPSAYQKKKEEGEQRAWAEQAFAALNVVAEMEPQPRTPK